MCPWSGQQSPILVHEMHSQKGAPALILWAGNIEKDILSKVAKLVRYIPGIASGSLFIMSDSFPKMKPNPEIEGLRIPTLSEDQHA